MIKYKYYVDRVGDVWCVNIERKTFSLYMKDRHAFNCGTTPINSHDYIYWKLKEITGPELFLKIL